MYISRARLKSDLSRWQSEGWVTAAGADAIERDWTSRPGNTALYGALAVLSAILLGCGAISFVDANWQAMPKLARLLLLGSGLAGSYVAAWALFRRGLDAFGHAAVLVGIAVFGGSIMLIAQMYQMDGNPSDAVWLWAVGALSAGWLLRSNPALGASVALLFVWLCMSLDGDLHRIHWDFLPMWALAAGGIAMTRWRGGLHLLALSLSGWLVMTCLSDNRFGDQLALAACGLALSTAAVAAGPAIDRWRPISGALLSYGMCLAYIGLFAIQFTPLAGFGARASHQRWAWGAVTLAVLTAAMAAGWRMNSGRVLWIAYAAFSIEIVALYVSNVGGMLGASAFFLVTGALMLALATLAYRMSGRVVASGGAAS